MPRSRRSVFQQHDHADLGGDDYLHRSRLGGRLPGEIARPFSDKEDLHLMYYLAHRAPSIIVRGWNYDKNRMYAYENHHGRGGNEFYKDLVASKREWARAHSWKGWRNRYIKASERFDEQIAEYLKENEWVVVKYPERRLVDFEDEPGCKESTEKRNTSEQASGYNASQELRNATPGPSQLRGSFNTSDRYSEDDYQEHEEEGGEEHNLPKGGGPDESTRPRSNITSLLCKPRSSVDDDPLEEESTDEEALAKRLKRVARKRASSHNAPFSTVFGIIPDDDRHDAHERGDRATAFARKVIALTEQRGLRARRAASNRPRDPARGPLPVSEDDDRNEQALSVARDDASGGPADNASIDIESTAVDRTASGFGSGFGSRAKPNQRGSLINFFEEQEQGPSRGSRSLVVELQRPPPNTVRLGISEAVLREAEAFERLEEEDIEAERLLAGEELVDDALKDARGGSIRAGKKRSRDDAFGGEIVGLGVEPKVAAKKGKKKKKKRSLGNNPSAVFSGAIKVSQDEIQQRTSLPSQVGVLPRIFDSGNRPRASLPGSLSAASNGYTYIPEIDFSSNSPNKVVTKVLRNSLTGVKLDAASALAVMHDNDYRPSPLRVSLVSRRSSSGANPSQHEQARESPEAGAAVRKPLRNRHRSTRSLQELIEEPIRPFARRTAREATNDERSKEEIKPTPFATALRNQNQRRPRSQTPIATGALVTRAVATATAPSYDHNGVVGQVTGSNTFPRRYTRATSIAR
ncbi:hypothetical protein FRB97_006072 [Tulasnella sp. 331]|nr:hypothetical protein FRB97_006072 [Tulasnella sp. 331]